MKRHTVTCLLLAVLIVSSPSASLYGAEIAGCFFSDVYTADQTKLRLIGVGLLSFWGFKAFTGAFYLEEGIAINEALSDRAKRIEIEYLRPIRGKDMGPVTDASIAKNVGWEIYNRLRTQINYHISLYEDVQPGDRYTLTYIPGMGTELALNGRSKGIVEGTDFAAAVFSILLGPEPINAALKKQILGIGQKQRNPDSLPEAKTETMPSTCYPGKTDSNQC